MKRAISAEMTGEDIMRNGILVVAVTFAISLAIVVGNRLPGEALAVIVGAFCGISASIPVSIGLVIAASRNRGRETTP